MSWTLNEASRCLRPGGTVILADTPMVPAAEERSDDAPKSAAAIFEESLRTPSNDALLELANTSLDDLLQAWRNDSESVGELIIPSYGVRWALRPLIARLRGKREPSRFRIYAAEVER